MVAEQDYPSEADLARTLQDRVIMHGNRVSGASANDIPGTNYGNDDSFDISSFRDKMQISIVRIAPDLMEFDLVGVDASIANAFRRIMIAEVPTMAIKTVYIMNNTSTIPDEMLAHRIGLLPIKADPLMFNYPVEGDAGTIDDTLVFRICATCQYNKNAKSTETDPAVKYIGANVESRAFYWMPQQGQLERMEGRIRTTADSMFQEYWQEQSTRYSELSRDFVPPQPNAADELQEFTGLQEYWKSYGSEVRWAVHPLHDDITVDKLRPGQIVDIQAHVTKGLGKDHAKWSPVCTASYRLLPDIIIKSPIIGDDAVKFQQCFPEGVIALRNSTVNGKKVKEAFVADARRDTVSRECLRHEEFKDKVVLTRIRDHFICKTRSLLC
eukprot:Partr_v1_DN25444_c0_g1_i3_m53412 putative DNA-directed RNA polymerases I and III